MCVCMLCSDERKLKFFLNFDQTTIFTSLKRNAFFQRKREREREIRIDRARRERYVHIIGGVPNI